MEKARGNMNMLRRVATWVISILLWAFPINAIASQSGQSVNLLSDGVDWIPQDFRDSQGVETSNLENGRLKITVKLTGGHSNFSKGEVYTDLLYVPDLECQVPEKMDFSQREIRVEVEVPVGFVGLPDRPNGIQLFVKDDKFRAQYSVWENVTQAGKYTLTLRPNAAGDGAAETTPGFTPDRIRIIGVKFSIGDGSNAMFNGVAFLNNININPPLTPSPKPELPPSTPPPALTDNDRIETKGSGFSLNDRRWFAVGGNWAGVEYGQNFGATLWFPKGNGVSKHRNYTRINFDYFRRAGIKVVRIGLFDDGRAMFKPDGRVTDDANSFNAFRDDVKTMLELAQQAGLKVEFTLLDFLIAGKAIEVDLVQLRGRPEIITDQAIRDEFRAKLLIPLLKECGAHNALLGFDVINEPEWLIAKSEGGAWEDVADTDVRAETPIPLATLIAFVNSCFDDIRTNASGKLAAVGVSATFKGLAAQLNGDYFAVHHYPWMGDLDPLIRMLPQGKPWVLEEFPSAYTTGTIPNSVTGYMNLTLNLGGTGAFVWNLKPMIDEQTLRCLDRPSALLEIRNWVDGHAQEIYPQSLATVSAASFLGAELAPESIVAAFGTGLATLTAVATDTDPDTPGVQLPTELAGTTVGVKDSAGTTRRALLFFVSPTQVNYQMPPLTAPGEGVVTIMSGDGNIAVGTIKIAVVAPGLFTANANGQGVTASVILRVRADGGQSFEPIAVFDTAQGKFVAKPIDLGPESDQVFLLLYGTGFRFRSALSAVSVKIGGVDMEALYAAEAPGFIGLDQSNVRLSRSLMGRGEVDVVLIVDGKPANTVHVSFK
jgi:uncharacterized protein (TIGR03437 family)